MIVTIVRNRTQKKNQEKKKTNSKKDNWIRFEDFGVQNLYNMRFEWKKEYLLTHNLHDSEFVETITHNLHDFLNYLQQMMLQYTK